MRLAIVVGFLFPSLSCSTPEADSVPLLPDHYDKKLEAFWEEKETNGNVLFLGNSITERGDFKALLQDTTIINRGISGDVTFGVIARIDEVTRFKPSKLFLLIGINDLGRGTAENVVLNNIFTIVSLIHSQSPQTQVFVQSILPVNPAIQNFPAGYDIGDKIRLVNGQLANLTKRLNYIFVDLHKSFTDVEGNLDAKYTFDGLHLTAEGYTLWGKILKDAKYL